MDLLMAEKQELRLNTLNWILFETHYLGVNIVIDAVPGLTSKNVAADYQEDKSVAHAYWTGQSVSFEEDFLLALEL